ncbi:hypothetical protein ZWY2020_010723 [Hordeum vulgare]|nr:hypothetical protein ZWY2020_010723 [Hordeum vulgare]
MLAGSARKWLKSLPAGSVNSWVDFKDAFVRNFTGTYKRLGRPRELAMCVQRPDEPLRDYVTRWTELGNSCEGVHEVHTIQYFIDGYRDGTLLTHKLVCSELTSLAVLMAKADKYATADSAMPVKVTTSDKVVPTSVHRLRLKLRLLVPLWLHHRRLATTAISTTTTPIRTEHSSSSPVKATTSRASASDGVR